MNLIPTLRRAIILCAVLICFAVDAQSQSDSLHAIPFADRWALEFGITENLTLRSFLGASFSGARYLSSGNKVRVGVLISGSDASSDSKSNEFRQDTLYHRYKGSDESTNHEIRLAATFLSYAPAAEDISLYAGFGPLMAWRMTESVLRSESVPPYSYEMLNEEHRARSFGLGASAVVGVEWFFAKRMSLHAEYGVEAMYEWGSSDDSRVYPPTYYGFKLQSVSNSTSKGWRVAPALVMFGISVCY